MFDPSWNPDAARPRPQRKLARFLVPVALVVVIAGTYVIVEHGLSTTHHHAAPVRTPPARLTRAQRFYAHRRYYTVRPGQSLTAIAAKTGVPVSRLEALNRNVNPNSLQLGQRLRLRR